MSLTDSGEHGTDLGDQRIRVRGECEGVLELVIEVGHAAGHRASPRREAERPAQYRAVVGCAPGILL